MKTRLLIDGDIVAFASAAAAQHTVVDDTGVFGRTFANGREGEALVDNMLITLRHSFKAEEMEVVLSDPDDNWRWHVDPAYKTNRTGERPVLLTYLKDYLRERYGAEHVAGLEADDVLSIRATTPVGRISPPVSDHAWAEAGGDITIPAVRTIVVGRDKDFNTIPGLHHTWHKDVSPDGKLLVREITEASADRFHLIQALAGDRVDGFAGCPGIGMTSAAKIIDNPVRLVPKPGVKTRGVNKGEAVTRWMAEPTGDLWACIVSHYRKAGLTEADALRTARLARLLRYGEYSSEKGVTLWTPDQIRRR